MNLLRLPVLVDLILIPLHGRIRSVKVNPDSQHRYWLYLAYMFISLFFSEFVIWHLHDIRWGFALGSSASRWKRILSGQFCIIMMAQSFALSSPLRRYIADPNYCAHELYSEGSLAQWDFISSCIHSKFISTLRSCCFDYCCPSSFYMID